MKVNWIKTVYFNLKAFRFSVAKKLPVLIYGRVKITDISGKIIINAPIKTGMIGFGQKFEKMTKAKGNAEINIRGTIVFRGYAHIGKDCFLFVGKDAYCELGNMTGLGSDVKIICTERIVLGDWARIGYESQVVDTNSHHMMDAGTGEKFPMSAPIHIGNYNSVSNRVSIMSKTVTPDYCVVASNAVLSKDYSNLGNEILLGGIPAKLIRKNFSRDWEGEKLSIEKLLIVCR
ncbi:MAG: transferase [Bacteroidetes bacterium]|nr:transferase [Bacteroidota bacterium]